MDIKCWCIHVHRTLACLMRSEMHSLCSCICYESKVMSNTGKSRATKANGLAWGNSPAKIQLIKKSGPSFCVVQIKIFVSVPCYTYKLCTEHFYCIQCVKITVCDPDRMLTLVTDSPLSNCGLQSMLSFNNNKSIFSPLLIFYKNISVSNI